ncbi:MAG: hypothetical protein V4760_11710 [Bdellovibrionota bacterium]
MNLKLSERPYSGTTYRPRPEIHVDAASGTFIVATPWGPREAARKVIDRMNDYLALAREDQEATSPFQKLSCLSDQANALRIATLLANEALYREENRTEYRAGVELFAGLINDDEFVWLQSGNPQILLARPGRTLIPLGSQIDLAYDLSEGGELLPALPSQLVGLDSSINLNINSFRARGGDKLVLISHSHLPTTLFGLAESEVTVDSLSRHLSRVHPDHAFWLGVLELGDVALEAAG